MVVGWNSVLLLLLTQREREYSRTLSRRLKLLHMYVCVRFIVRQGALCWKIVNLNYYLKPWELNSARYTFTQHFSALSCANHQYTRWEIKRVSTLCVLSIRKYRWCSMKLLLFKLLNVINVFLIVLSSFSLKILNIITVPQSACACMREFVCVLSVIVCRERAPRERGLTRSCFSCASCVFSRSMSFLHYSGA